MLVEQKGWFMLPVFVVGEMETASVGITAGGVLLTEVKMVEPHVAEVEIGAGTVV